MIGGAAAIELSKRVFRDRRGFAYPSNHVSIDCWAHGARRGAKQARLRITMRSTDLAVIVNADGQQVMSICVACVPEDLCKAGGICVNAARSS